jgi:NAD(P)-dependent dehydrogenase (short-subunit alcohol dehydrogenase family)
MNASFLSGKLALVTGGSGTIGQAIAKSLLSSGASVVLTARRLEKLETAKEKLLESLQLKSADAPQVHVISSDVSKEESVVELFQKIDDLSTGVDLLINNAGTNEM